MAFTLTWQTISIAQTKIELFVPNEEAVKQAYSEEIIPFPYWSKIWPSAIALSKFVFQHQHFIQNKMVAELGAGLGLPSLVAARYARSVLCSDYVTEAVDIAQLSAIHNHLSNLKTAVIDWHHLPTGFNADVLLLSDVNYEPTVFAELLDLVDYFLRAGTILLISTPQRLMAKDFIAPLLKNVIQKEEIVVEKGGHATMVTVLVLASI